MSDYVVLPVAITIVVAAAVSVYRGVDVRLALIVAAFAIAGLKGDVAPIVAEFLATLSNEKFVVPICTAMGFAYVLRHTECDQHLVRLLTRPLRSARVFLIPGVVAVGFLVNIPVISQTSTAVCIGAVVVPLMRAAGLTPVTIGASILLGASIGGELLNPGAPELNTVAQRLGVSPTEVVPAVQRLLFIHLGIATLLFWFGRWRHERAPAVPATAEAGGRVNVVRAAVPLVPLALLYLQGEPLKLFHVPEAWVVGSPVSGRKDLYYETRLIGAAMLAGVLVAGLVTPRRVGGVPRAFFEGAGYAFTEVISLIVVANCFGKAIALTGLTDLMARAIGHQHGLLVPLAGLIPMGFAALTGSGMAATQSLYGAFVDPAVAAGADLKDTGAVVSIAAAAGRTMSPVAAVALMSAKLTGTNPFELARRVAGPLAVSLAIVLALRMAGLV